MRRPARHLAEQICTANHLIHGARANTGQNLTDFLRIEGDQIDDLICRPGELVSQRLILRANTHRAGVRLALPHHDAAHRDQSGGTDAIFFRTHHGRHHDIAARAQPAISAQCHPFTQIVHGQNLMRLGQTHFPRQAGKFDRRRWRSARAAIMAGDQNHIGLSLRHAGGDRAHPRGRHQFHRHLTARVDLLEIVNQLRQIFDGIDIMMWRWADQGHTFGRMTQAGNEVRNLHTGQLSALAGLGPLRHFDFQFLTVIEIFRRDPKAA